MSTFKTYFTINCYSFTFLMLIYTVLTKLDIFPSITSNQVLIYYFMTLCTTVLIAITDLLPIKNMMLATLIRTIDIIIVVFSLSFIFELFTFKWTTILTIVGMIVAIHLSIMGLLLIKDKSDANLINKQLSRRMLESQKTGREGNE